MPRTTITSPQFCLRWLRQGIVIHPCPWLRLLCRNACLLVAAALRPADAADDVNPPPRIDPARDTTYFTEPLTAIGEVDYVTAFNRHVRGDLKPEDNAAVGLWQVFGFERIPEDQRAAFRQWLGDPADIPEAQRWIRPDEYLLEQHGLSHQPLDSVLATHNRWQKAPPAALESRKRYAACLNAPWTEKTDPTLYALLRRNAHALLRIKAASQATRVYSPLLPAPLSDGGPSLLMSRTNPFPLYLRDAVDLLCCRAMWYLAHHQAEKGLNDLLTARRLARFARHAPLMDLMLSGSQMESDLLRREAVFCGSGMITAQDGRAYLKGFEQLPPAPRMSEVIGLGDRVLSLEAAQLAIVHPERTTGTLKPVLDRLFLPHPTDFNTSLREYNSAINAIADIDQTGPWPEVQARISEQEERHKEPAKYGKEILDEIAKGTPESRGRIFGRMLRQSLPVEIGSKYEHERNMQARDELSRLSIALAIFHAENRRWPQRLDELVPTVLTELPLDPYTDEPYRFRHAYGDLFVYSVGPDGVDDQGLVRGDPEIKPDNRGLEIRTRIPLEKSTVRQE